MRRTDGELHADPAASCGCTTTLTASKSGTMANRSSMVARGNISVRCTYMFFDV
jgi:hypothetical protein